jgi:hypothetical protein
LPVAPKRKEFLSPPKIDLNEMRRVLEEAVANDTLPRPSLNQLARRLGCRLTTLGRRYPELAQAVKDRHQRFCAIRKEVRANLFRSLVRTAVINIHRSGEYPSQSRVRESLPKFVDMREPAAYDAWRQTLTELQLSA